jgi:hypothetical protein
MSTICFYAPFTASKTGVNGLTVTWDVEQITRTDGTRSALVTGGANGITIGRRGLYGYVLTGADLTLYDYIATAITEDTSVDQKEVQALWTLWAISWHDIATSIMTIAGSIGKLLVGGLSNLEGLILSVPAAPVPSWPAGQLAVINSVSYRETISNVTIPSTWTKIWLTVKRSVERTDDQSILQLVVSNPADDANDGILRLYGAEVSTDRTKGSLTVNQGSGTIAIVIENTLELSESVGATYVYDIKAKVADGSTALLCGIADFKVVAPVTDAVE